MADPDRPKKATPKTSIAPNKPTQQKVSQATINSMKTMGMSKAISKANSGSASAEFVEGAKRMYGNRIKTDGADRSMRDRSPILKQTQSATVTKTAAKPKTDPKKDAYDKSQAAIKKMPKQFKKNESAM